MRTRMQANRNYFYLLLADRVLVFLLFAVLIFVPWQNRTGYMALTLFALYQILVFAVFCIRFLGPIREIEKISEMIEKPENHMADIRGGRPIHKIIQHVKQSVENEYTSQMLASKAEIHALQSQINPHFLYNTLDTIRSMAIIRDSEEIAQMAEALSMLFRYSISRPGEMTTLKDELDNVKNYLLIQGYRFPGRFKYQQKIEDGEILQYKLPVLTLQPVIENAVHHGLETKVGGGQVSIRAYRTRERFIIRIADNGTGMTETQLEVLRDRLSRGGSIDSQDRDLRKHRNTGIALTNVNQRIKFYYGDDFGIKVYSTAGVGTIVEIILPSEGGAKGGEV